MDGLKFIRRFDKDGNAVICYYRDATYRIIYRSEGDSAPWAYEGDSDRPLRKFDSIGAFEEFARGELD